MGTVTLAKIRVDLAPQMAERPAMLGSLARAGYRHPIWPQRRGFPLDQRPTPERLSRSDRYSHLRAWCPTTLAESDNGGERTRRSAGL